MTTSHNASNTPKHEKSNVPAPVVWSIAIGTAAMALAFARRTRGYDKIHPDLRSPAWWLRTPSIGRTNLPLVRVSNGKATECVEGVALETRHIAADDGTDLTVYVYRPERLVDAKVAMLYTHGGGMILGSAAAYHELVSRYARELGIVLVSVDYRLAPEHPFPTPLDDVHAAWRWLVAESPTLGIDAAQIAVGGESAGGGLTAALCQRLLDEGGPQPVFQLLIYPMIDDRTTLGPAPEDRGQLLWTEGSNRFAWRCYLGSAPVMRDAPAYAAPARRTDLAGLPPAWIGVGTLDLFYDEDADYARRLNEAGVPCAFEAVEGAFHGFDALSSSPVSTAFHASVLNAVRAALSIAQT